MNDDIVQLEAERVRFFSGNDESAFFEWIKKIECITKISGAGPVIILSVSREKLSENCLRELLSLFRRYNVGMRQLAVFDRCEFSAWFRDKRAYWYTSIFGES